MKKFLFIIPLTPANYLNQDRKIIQDFCFKYLFKQEYDYWQALVIGNDLPISISNNSRFIHIEYEGIKELKIQIATNYIIENKMNVDYIIRLDDDDFFNPTILNKLANLDFDLYTDKFHSFYEFQTNKLSQQIRLWFPNTCVHKFEHAMAIYGKLSNPGIKEINQIVRLIENNHAKFHEFYKGKKIIFANKRNPLYLRVLNKDSITAKLNMNYESYLKKFGYWKKNKLSNFQIEFPFKDNKIDYSIKDRIFHFFHQFSLYLFYDFYLHKN